MTRSRARWFADGGTESNPDHWRCERDERYTLTAWPRLRGAWVWEVWDATSDSDDPALAGEASSFEEAKSAAEDAASKHK